MWLAAENGMFLHSTKGTWMTTMPKHSNLECVDSVKHVFEYFTERTPRSHFELRETSLVWNYKYADVEFGRLQARDMLQHLWTGSISNASVDVVQGSRSVEVRAAGVTKVFFLVAVFYSFVARGTVILSEYTEFTGNFITIAAQCLQKLPATNNKFTYNCDGHTFNSWLKMDSVS